MAEKKAKYSTRLFCSTNVTSLQQIVIGLIGWMVQSKYRFKNLYAFSLTFHWSCLFRKNMWVFLIFDQNPKCWIFAIVSFGSVTGTWKGTAFFFVSLSASPYSRETTETLPLCWRCCKERFQGRSKASLIFNKYIYR